MSDEKSIKMNDKDFNNILKKLKKIFEIYDVDYIEEEKVYSIFSEFFAGTLSGNKKEFRIQFQADTKPEIAATTILILKEKIGFEKITILESFYVNREQNFFYGDMAYFNFNQDLIHSIREQTIDEIYQLKYLQECGKLYNC